MNFTRPVKKAVDKPTADKTLMFSCYLSVCQYPIANSFAKVYMTENHDVDQQISLIRLDFVFCIAVLG
jgi:hypothetical protein